MDRCARVAKGAELNKSLVKFALNVTQDPNRLISCFGFWEGGGVLRFR